MDSYWDYATTAVLLEDWKIHTNATPYTAPELIFEWMTGKVYGHPDHEDGRLVTTSPIKQRVGECVTTQNTDYILGAEISDAH